MMMMIVVVVDFGLHLVLLRVDLIMLVRGGMGG